MARDILSEYGPESTSGSRAINGGQCVPKDIPYSPPVGPIGIGNKGVGLGGTNYGTSGTQGKR